MAAWQIGALVLSVCVQGATIAASHDLHLVRVNGRIFPAHFFCLKGTHTLMSWSQTVEKTVTAMGYELVDLERSSGGLLRVYIDRMPGRSYLTGESEFVLVEDCEAVTRQLQYVLEVDNVDYARLEVSSPGLDRPLKTSAHYARFVGEQVIVTLKVPFQGRKKYEGQLLAGEADDAWRLVFHDGKVDQVLDFTLAEVREARLVPVIDFKGRRGKKSNAPAAGPEPVDAATTDGDSQE